MELLTVNETAQMLRLTPITVRRYIASGRLSAVRVGRRVRVRKEAAEDLVRPMKAKRQVKQQPRVPRGRPTGPDDRYWTIVGIGCSDGPGDVSSNKHKYLAEAYYAEASPPKER